MVDQEKFKEIIVDRLGVDPNEMRFRRSSCFDVGLECGGWGRIVLELSVRNREQLEAQQDQRT